MSYTVRVLRSAAKRLDDLPAPVRARLRAALDELAQDPRPHSSLKLTAQSAWRLHVGDYRIVYTIDDQEHVVNIVWVGPRKDAYRPS
ncbi:MAG TPA: type II toxin-antitoxin system RelE/ParE family toxin [Anaerolineae bacterium]|nr:type II toxin-antitoxin system RelE/ParE family toxin [Anaerolineae bacterium]HOR00258.1 type II toxin-antitoxin system RelE/ParE family toxin [Anaerolineae bacterium]HPL30767.1 type II toxin-antitoxin system RelE/ParE family toxin [Anaerolineae bacterium]